MLCYMCCILFSFILHMSKPPATIGIPLSPPPRLGAIFAERSIIVILAQDKLEVSTSSMHGHQAWGLSALVC